MWCLWRLSAMSLCSWEINLTNASPLRRPCGDKHNATPPLQLEWMKRLIECGELEIHNFLHIAFANSQRLKTYFATFKPRKNFAISWSLLCHGSPRARTMQFPSISSSIELECVERKCVRSAWKEFINKNVPPSQETLIKRRWMLII